MKKTQILACALLAMASLLKAGQNLEYKEGKTLLTGYLAQPAKASGAAVVIVHQWMGLTDYEKGRAEQLAALGYTALAADIYGAEDTPKDMAAAGKAAGKYKGDRALYRSRVKAAIKALAAQKGVNKKQIIVMGYCFGGTGALEAARAGAEIAGAVSFHGGLETPLPAKAGAIKCPILVLHGADDPYVKAEEVAAFENEMRSAKADWQFIKYSGAVHAFTQPGAGHDNSKGAAYNEKADKRSWQALLDFMAEVFKAKP